MILEVNQTRYLAANELQGQNIRQSSQVIDMQTFPCRDATPPLYQATGLWLIDPKQLNWIHGAHCNDGRPGGLIRSVERIYCIQPVILSS